MKNIILSTGGHYHLRWFAVLFLAACAVLPGRAVAAALISIEGEAPATVSVTRHPWWYEKVKKDMLSGGDFLAHFDDAKAGEASYQASITEAGDYQVWVRANPTQTALSWKLDAGAWSSAPMDKAIDIQNIADNGAPDLRFLGWVDLGQSKLSAGAHTLSFRFEKGGAPQYHGSIDKIILCNDPDYCPSGKATSAVSVAEKKATSRIFDASDAWAFPTDDDRFAPDAVIDLGAMLNEKVAGEKGFVRLSEDRMSFVRGDGQPIRFWGVVSNGADLKPEEMERHAAWLAKRGVNMARIHAQICNTKEGAKVTDVDEKLLDNILRWVAVCKRHGIYVTLSPYWAYVTVPASWGIDDYAGSQVWGVLFFNPKLQEGYRAWLKALYTRPNPYANNVPLKDEPAVAIAQAQNEDSLLFWTFNGIKPAQRRLLGSRFFNWAMARYGSIEKIQAAWKNAAAEGDDIPGKVLGFRNLYELTGSAPLAKGGMAVRLADQLEFLTETQRDFYAGLETYFKKELGIRSLTNAMNWRSADQVTMDDAERYTYSPMDVTAVNYYTGGAHIGKNNGYRIDPGHLFTNDSVMKGTAPLPCNLKQSYGHPMLITETAWVHPNLYQSEGPFLMTAYQSLSGVDVTYWFSFPGKGTPEWEKDPRAMFWPVGGSYAGWKWYGNFSMQAGQFPAFALAYRLGYIAQAKAPAVYEERSMEDLWQRRIPIISESGRFDPNRDAGAFAPESPLHQEVSRDAFFVGPVVVKFGGEAKNNQVADLSRYIDKNSGDIRSLTGQLLINQKRGIATIDAPKVQGVCGFLREAGGDFKLGSTQWETTNGYAALAAVSLDGKDLATSSRILVQVGTTTRLSGFAVRDARVKAEGIDLAGEELVSTGKPPWLVAKTHVTLTLTNKVISRATALDPNLYRRGSVPVKRKGDQVTVELPADSLYTILE